METSHAILGKNIRSLRMQTGLTQSDLADQAECSVRLIQCIEGRGVKPNAVTAVLIAKALGTTVESLVKEPRA